MGKHQVQRLAHEVTTAQALPRDCIKIGLAAETHTEARQVVNDIQMHCNGLLALDQLRFRRHRFTALDTAQSWSNQRFNEIHWLRASPSDPIPYPQLFAHAKIVHVHHLDPPASDTHPHARHYLWRSWDELAAYWASLYVARENPSVPGLDWNSYTTWSPGPGFGQVTNSWGTTAPLAATGLLAQVQPADHAGTTQALLLIESNLDLTIGDLTNVVDRLGAAIECQVIATGWLSKGHSGCGLKLLRFGPA